MLLMMVMMSQALPMSQAQSSVQFPLASRTDGGGLLEDAFLELQVCRYRGKLFSLNNRRLYCLKQVPGSTAPAGPARPPPRQTNHNQYR